eukprot:scaffold59346_cov18-Prasinocladus_malaysianus.AAC.1
MEALISPIPDLTHDIYSIMMQEGRFLGDMWNHNGRWAEKIFVGSGTKEYSATRDHDWWDMDQLLLHYNQEVRGTVK